MYYFDNAATTPVRSEAVQAAVEAMERDWGNPSSRCTKGEQAAARLKGWREDVAGALGCQAQELAFTSCGTESNNWAIRGAAELARRKGRHIITDALEHAAVLEPCRELERQGYEVTRLQPDRGGNLSLEAFRKALRPDTVLVSVMLVNNELGTVNPVDQFSAAVRQAGCPALVHCDAVQGFLKLPFTPQGLGVDLLSVSGHKVHAPKGIGALYIRRGLKLPPLLLGGGQEEGRRSGTEATAQIAAFAAAVRAGRQTLDRDLDHMAQLKAYAIARLALVPGLKPLTQGGAPHILPVTMPGYQSEVLVRFLADRDICLSSGSACHKGRPSHVFAALNLPKPERDGVLRISFSPENTPAEVDALADGLKAAHAQLFPSMS
ncbi:MAG: cysteine desulfurase [Lawsonibacter sp.]|nr:cysteine desulfurase [Lawsonibacter sp.]